MDFSGVWCGVAESYTSAHLKVKIIVKGNDIQLYALTNAFDGTNELITLSGVLKEEKADLELVSYLSDEPDDIPPNSANITLEHDKSADTIEGRFITNQGTSGTIKLKRGGFSTKLLFFIPIGIHYLYKRNKRFIKHRIGVIYFLLLILLATMSVIGFFPEKISVTESLVLSIPLLFLFSRDITKVISDLRVSKLGPIEFKEQNKPNKEVNIPKLINNLQEDFGENLPLFTALFEFFVPRTKILLKHLVENGRSLTLEEFTNIAINIGIQRSNIDATLQALISGQCIEVNKDGLVTITDTAINYLKFESIISEFRNL